MAQRRRHPVLLPCRVTAAERAAIDLLADAEGVPVARWLRSVLIPEVGRRLACVSRSGEAAA